jgi:single-strand DNA-binding protein
MFNKVILIGRLTAKPELKYTNSGNAVTNFDLAVQRTYKNPTTDEYDVDFISCVAWTKTAEVLAHYTDKGHKIGVSGRLEIRKWIQEVDGGSINRYATEVIVEEVVFLESKPKKEEPKSGLTEEERKMLEELNAKVKAKRKQDENNLPF